MSRWRVAAGLTCLALAGAAVAYPILWQHHQDVVGGTIVGADRTRARQIARTAGAEQVSCRPREGPGVLDIPMLHVAAPVEQGLSDGVLAVALGHDPTTPWPGPSDASLIAGHDVGYLSADTRLRAGDTFSYEEPCATLHYKVVGHEVTAPGQKVTLPAGGGIVLDSCWPTDALWFTSQRYLVIARYVSTSSGVHHPGIAASPPVPVVHLPAGLAPTQLTLTTNSWPMGTLRVTGTPAASWRASQAALDAESDALELLFGLRHALDTAQPGWIETLAPGVAVPSWLAAPPAARLDVTEDVNGRVVKEITLSSSVEVGSGTTTFALTATATVSGQALLVTGIHAEP